MRSLSLSTSAKLFATGFTIGPVVDSLHNQCLLQYKILPIAIPWPTTTAPSIDAVPANWDSLLLSSTQPSSFLFCSSWTVPPLLGIAYVVLGGILPRILESLLARLAVSTKNTVANTGISASASTTTSILTESQLFQKAWLAVTTTALIIKLSEFLQTTHPSHVVALSSSSSSSWLETMITLGGSEGHFLWMLLAALTQWAWLDQSLVGLLAASITMVGGPLSELPFVAYQVWEYLPTAADYFPLAHLPSWLDAVATTSLGEGYEQRLALSSITGPCYFAVTMDAIALGRWFDSLSGAVSDEDNTND